MLPEEIVKIAPSIRSFEYIFDGWRGGEGRGVTAMPTNAENRRLR